MKLQEVGKNIVRNTIFKADKSEERQGERGNVLFLILIAVALFAALSYAVTSSSRSGGGDANDETNLISSATITQYPASVRTAIIRMIVSSGVSTEELEFNVPGNAAADDADFEDCSNSGTNCVFHPAGGGATYVEAPADVVTGTVPQAWVFNAENEINLVGLSGTANNTFTDAEADVIAFLPNVRDGICRRINEELGIGNTIPTETGIDVTTNMDNDDGGSTPTGVCDGGCDGTIGSDQAALDGQAFGCFEQGGNNYYYHVLIEQ